MKATADLQRARQDITGPEAPAPASATAPAELHRATSAALEADALARELGAAYRGIVEFYRAQYKLPVVEALAKAQTPDSPEYTASIMEGPADQVSWFSLHYLMERNPDLAARCWAGVRSAALAELQSGHRAAKAMEGYSSAPWGRAQFLAIRDDLAQGWQPRNGIERQLIDAMAQAQAAALLWMGRLSVRCQETTDEREARQRDRWLPPRLSEAEAVEQAAAMFERFNRVFLRSLRVLQELRRHGPAVVVQNAGQVNVAQQQVNVNAGNGPAPAPAATIP